MKTCQLLQHRYINNRVLASPCGTWIVICTMLKGLLQAEASLVLTTVKTWKT